MSTSPTSHQPYPPPSVDTAFEPKPKPNLKPHHSPMRPTPPVARPSSRFCPSLRRGWRHQRWKVELMSCAPWSSYASSLLPSPRSPSPLSHAAYSWRCLFQWGWTGCSLQPRHGAVKTRWRANQWGLHWGQADVNSIGYRLEQTSQRATRVHLNALNSASANATTSSYRD
jgi:hypothetical protein